MSKFPRIFNSYFNESTDQLENYRMKSKEAKFLNSLKTMYLSSICFMMFLSLNLMTFSNLYAQTTCVQSITVNDCSNVSRTVNGSSSTGFQTNTPYMLSNISGGTNSGRFCMVEFPTCSTYETFEAMCTQNGSPVAGYVTNTDYRYTEYTYQEMGMSQIKAAQLHYLMCQYPNVGQLPNQTQEYIQLTVWYLTRGIGNATSTQGARVPYIIDPIEDNATINSGEQFLKFYYHPNSQNMVAYQAPATIGDYVWLDANGDGVQDANEYGLEGAVVTLSNDTGATMTLTTDASGEYEFSCIPPGDYTVSVDLSGVSNLPNGISANDLTPTTSPGGASLNPGDVNLEQDFGYTAFGSVGDTVWFDANGNGVQDNGETGIEGAIVTITNAQGDFVSTTTDANGNYLFSNVPAGSYTVSVTGDENTVLPTHVELNELFPTATPSGFTLAAGEERLDQDFGFNALGTIGDTVWLDTNGNGVQDNGEQGLSNVTVTLTDSQGGTVTTTTDANGSYTFDNVSAGSYTVSVDMTNADNLPTNVTAADLSATTTPSGFTLAAGEDRLDQDFGFNGLGTVGDTVWLDTNGNGVQDNGEQGLSNVTVTLTDSQGGTVTTTTDADGSYTFENVMTGNYTVTVDITNTSNLPTNVSVEDLVATSTPSSFDLNIGEDRLDQDFGFNTLGSVGDYVWFDTNGNGLQDNGEQGLTNVTVQLLDEQGNVIDSQVTDADGAYLFENVPAGTYSVNVDPSGANNLPPSVTSDEIYLTTTHTQFTLAIGENNLNQDFGYDAMGIIGDTVWYDADADGIKDADESGIVGAVVRLFQGGTLIETVVTNSIGYYRFDGLAAGDYEVVVNLGSIIGGLPAGVDVNDLSPTYDYDGVGTLNSSSLTLNTGECNKDQDFGYAALGEIGDTVWLDADADGIIDVDESGIEGATVVLTRDGSQVATTTTNQYGNYSFDNLPVGEYTVSVSFTGANLPAGVTPSDLVATADYDGISTESSSTKVLEVGSDNLDQDFGYTVYGSIGDRVWYDENADGVQDGTEDGIMDVIVKLYKNNNLVAQQLTDSNGGYTFDDLPSGMYTVETNVLAASNLPQGVSAADLTATYDADGSNTANTSTLTLGLGEENADQDFGYVAPQSAPTPLKISGYVFYDSDNNDIVDGTKYGPVGTYAILVNADNDEVVATELVVQSVGSSNSGYFEFDGTSHRNYYVMLYTPNSTLSLPVVGAQAPFVSTLPAGIVSVSDAIGVGTPQTGYADGISTIFDTTDGKDVTHVDFGVLESTNLVTP